MGVLPALILVLSGFRPMVLLSIFAFLCPPTWWHDENVDYPYLDHVIIWSCALICWSIKIFSHSLVGFVRFDSDPLGPSSYGAFVQFCFSLSAQVIAWWECWLSTPVSGDHGIVHLDCWSIKIFSHFWGVLSALILIIWGFRPMVLLSIFAFLYPPTWSHDENVDYPHLYHVIIWSCALIVGVLKHFLIFGGFVRFDSDPLVLSSYGAFVPFCFSLSAHCDRMTRMLIVHTCISWSWDRTPWLLEY